MKHAKLRPPSAAHRWLSCPGSVNVLKTYSNGDSVHSTRGEIAHELLMAGITFGVVPNHPDIDLVYSAMFALEKVIETYDDYRAKAHCQIYTEQELDIPQTGEFGTSDIILVTPTLIHIMDFKNGYIPVDVHLNAQLMTYLLGAIAKYGERRNYKISVIQPNYVHIGGMYRTEDVTPADIEWFEREIQYAMVNTDIVAGKHCKTSYCPHRGACPVFLAWAQENLKLAWYPGEIGSMDDDTLAQALDEADILTGYRDNLRAEGLRRILNQNRDINGYKLVRGKKDRLFASDKAREEAFNELRSLGVTDDELYEKVPISVAGVDRICKRLCKNGEKDSWMNMRDFVLPPHRLQPQNQSLVLEKAIDGRKPYKRGAEFTALIPPAPTVDATSNTSNTSELKELGPWPTPPTQASPSLMSLSHL